MRPRCALIALATLLLAACASADSRARHADSIWQALETPACDLPCWHGIIPGESTAGQVEATMQSLGFVAGVKCFDVPDAEETPGSRAGAFCTWESALGYPIWGGAFQFDREGDERLTQNLMFFRRPVSLELAVAHFGTPGSAWVIDHTGQGGTCSCQSSLLHSSQGGMDADLLYPSLGMILSAETEEGAQYPCLCAAMEVDSIALYQMGDATALDEWWRQLFGYGLDQEGGIFFDFTGFAVPFR